MTQDIDNSRDYMVVQANDFIRHARTSKLTSLEADIAYFLMSKIKPKDSSFMEIIFTVEEFYLICGNSKGFNDSGKNYASLKNSLRSLANKSAWIEESNGDEVLVRWVDTYRLKHNDGTIVATLSKSLEPYLLNLQKHYTQTTLRNFISLKSKYSKRLYDYLRSFLHSKLEHAEKHYEVVFEIMDLKKQLNAENYGRFKDFRVNVLELAEREINAVTDMEIKFEPIKTGRITTHIKFIIKIKGLDDRLTAMVNADKAIDKRYSN